MKLKVLHYMWSPGMGGISRLVLDLCQAQSQDRNLDVTLLIGRLDGSMLPLFQDAGISIRHADLNSGADVSPRSLLHLVRILQDYDLVHLHNFHPAVALSCWIARSKVLYMVHGNFGLYRRQRMQDYIIHFLKGFYLRNFVHMITFNSYFTASTSKKMYGIKKVDNRVIYNGSACLNESSSKGHVDRFLENFCNGHFIVGTVARLTEQKRLDRLLRGFAEFSKKNDSILLVIGDGPERDALEKIATDLDIKDCVQFLGFKHPVTPYLLMMDVCVFPSAAEAFGLVAVEAFAVGKPTIVFADGGGLVEIVKPLEPLDVVADEGSLANRLGYYSRVHSIGDSISSLRIAYSKKFSIERMTKELIIVYKDMMGSSFVD